jgi:transposase
MRVAAPLALRIGDRERLASMASLAGSAGAARRARMVLLAADGLPHTEIAEQCGTSVPTVRHWRARYQAGGIRALQDLPRSGRPRTVDEAVIVVRTLESPPERLGVTHWSSRLLARDLGISSASVVEIWRKWHLQPWLRQSFKFSADPALDAKITDVVGLYLAPPENAVVVCVNEKSQHGTTALYAALDVATRQVTDTCYSRHRHQEFLRFLKKVAAACPGYDLHVVCDNCTTHEHPEVRAWLAKIPRVTLHLTPTGCSWLSMVEIFFAIITRRAMRGGTCCSSKDLSAKIGAFIDGWNEHFELFAWTKTADELRSASRSGRRPAV